MYAQSADGAFLSRETGIYILACCGVKGFATISDGKLKSHLVSLCLDMDVSLLANGIGILHNIDYGFFHSEVELGGGVVVDVEGYANLLNKGGELRYGLHIVREGDIAKQTHLTVLLGILYGKHGEVVSLFVVAHKLLNRFVHLVDDALGVRCVVVGFDAGSHVEHALLAKLLVLFCLSLGESVGIEEYGCWRVDGGFLSVVSPFMHKAQWDVGGDRQE